MYLHFSEDFGLKFLIFKFLIDVQFHLILQLILIIPVFGSKELVYSWFNWSPVDRWSSPDSYSGMQETFDLLRKVFVEHGPFDGVLGFSQGGVVLSVLTGMRAEMKKSSLFDKTCDNPIAFDFAIFCSTFAPPVQEYLEYPMKSNKCAPLNTLHVYGIADPLVNFEMSKRLAQIYEKQVSQNAEENCHITTVSHLEHQGGHYVPSNSASKAIYKQFFEGLSLSRN